MKIKYLGLKVVIVLTTIMATPLVWAALAYPEWQANAGTAAESGQVAAEPPPVAAPPVERRIIIVPRLVYTQSAPVANAPSAAAPNAPVSRAPAAPQQPIAAAPPPQAAPAPPRASAPPARNATTRGS